MTEERDSDRELEALKMYQDNFKTLMTFSSGALVVVATVVGAFWPKPEHLWVLAVSLAFFLFGTAVALWGLVSVQRHVNDPENQNKFYLHNGLWLAVIFPYIGVTALGFFALFNFLPGN